MITTPRACRIVPTGVMRRVIVAVALLGTGGFFASVPAAGQEAPAPEAKESSETPKTEDQVTKIGEHRYRLGAIEFDARKREVRLPAVMNMREGGPLEYLLVHENGAVHESLLTTAVRGLNLQVVLKLLRFKSGEGDLFDAFLPEEERRQKIENAKPSDRGDAIDILVSWQREEGEEAREHPVSQWVLDAETGEAMTEEPWILTGSHFYNGNFLADTQGSLIGIYLDQVALFNMSRKSALNDERWGANDKLTPEVGQKVTLILRPTATTE